MTKKIEHLTNELQDFFSETDSKKLSKKLGELLEVREGLVPNKTYKQTLKTRLKHIHMIEKKSSFSLLSFLRYSGVFASFLFLSGASYMYYTIQQAGLQDAIGVQMQDEATSESFSQSTMMETLVTPNSVTQDEVTSTENIQQRETQNTPVQEIPPISTQKTSKIQEIKPQVQENMGVPGVNVSVPIVSGEEVGVGNMRSVAPENQSDGEESPQDEFILTEIMDVFETPVQNEKAFPMQDANQGGDMMLKGVSPMMFGVDPFFEICSSYSGSLSDDGEKCFFSAEQFCTRENIFPESETLCEYIPKLPRSQE